MTWVFNPVTRQVDDVDETVAAAYEQLLNRLAADPAAFPLGLPPDADRLLAGTLDAARTVASAQTAKEGELALRGATAAADNWVEAVGAHESQPAPARQRRTPPRLIVPWQPAELARVQDRLPGRYQLMTDLGAGLGLRQGELVGFCLEDFDTGLTVYRVRVQVKRVDGILVFAPPKHERERSVPLAPELRDAAAAHAAAHGTVRVTLPWRTPDGRPRTLTLLFTGQNGTPVDRAYLNRLWKTAVLGAGLTWIPQDTGMHMLRHIAASRWIAAGADVLMARDLLGHADTTTTERYMHRLKTHDRRTRAVVARAQPKTARRKPAVLPAGVADLGAYRSRRSS